MGLTSITRYPRTKIRLKTAFVCGHYSRHFRQYFRISFYHFFSIMNKHVMIILLANRDSSLAFFIGDFLIPGRQGSKQVSRQTGKQPCHCKAHVAWTALNGPGLYVAHQGPGHVSAYLGSEWKGWRQPRSLLQSSHQRLAMLVVLNNIRSHPRALQRRSTQGAGLAACCPADAFAFANLPTTSGDSLSPGSGSLLLLPLPQSARLEA
ncbi:hypothetical protein BDY21DRAFT_54210 [Lineolata rhizophorae]|uniref:Uncharacterized protein n=1 Tax=Lineolata rhizophorae TaxID=578093 RepID=A0A6A6NY07_9PEZI|nr:hypothetical protein BDY21DRAFT_54210 [Lineolata rhizophorae]